MKMKQGAVRLFRLKVNPHTEQSMASLCRKATFLHSAIGHNAAGRPDNGHVKTAPRRQRGHMSRAEAGQQSNGPAIVLAALILAGCSSPRGQAPSGHHHEVALAWATGSTTDGFHFPISCPGPEKLVLFGNAKFQMSCDGSEKIKSTMADLAGYEPASDDSSAPARKSEPLKCYLVVVPDFKTVPGVVTDMRRAIAAKRTGQVDCALIRYD
jgi:hypothetical protein